MAKREPNPRPKALMIYLDLADNIRDLPDESAGQLFKACFDFSVNGTIPDFSDLTTRFVWRQIEASLIRNRQKYESRCLKNEGSGILRSLYGMHNTARANGDDLLPIEREILRVGEKYGIEPNPQFTEQARKQAILEASVEEPQPEPTAEERAATTGEQLPRAIDSGKDGSGSGWFSFRNGKPEELPFS